VRQTATKPQTEDLPEREVGTISVPEVSLEDSREWQAGRLRLLWGRRQFFVRVAGIALAVSTFIAFLIPKQYTSTAQLMPPDAQSTSGMAMMAAFCGKGGRAGIYGGRSPRNEKHGSALYRRPKKPDFTGSAHPTI